MLGAGKFGADVNACVQLVRSLELFGDRNTFPRYETLERAAVRQLGVGEQWRYYVKNGLFDLRLRDSALLQYRRTSASDFGYLYIECPFDAVSYEEYLERERGLSYGVVGDVFREEHELYVADAPQRQDPLSVRYDFSPGTYRAGGHPASHLHVGVSPVRIATRRILTPTAFMLFVVRQVYPVKWPQCLSVVGLEKVENTIREGLEPVDGSFWADADRAEMVLE